MRRSGRFAVEFPVARIVRKRQKRRMKPIVSRRDFTRTALLTTASLAATGLSAAETSTKKIRTGVIGCGSVSNSYLPELTKSPFVDVVSLCDIKPERAQKQAERFKIAHH